MIFLNDEENQVEINKQNIPQEYIVPLQGKMNKGVYDCINSGWGGNCTGDVSHRKNPYGVIEDIIGFAPSQWGTMVVWKCKSCGQIQCFHLRENEPIQHHDYVRMYHEYKTTGSYE